jgi:hypothetical protein
MPRPKFPVRTILAAVAVIAMTLASAKSLFIDNRPQDVLFAVISVLDGDFTVYVKGYSESKFRSLRVGMTAGQVEDIMGPPLSVGQWQEPVPGQPITPGDGPLHDLWRYTRSGKAMGNYWEREVWFKNGVVHNIERTFYLD